MFTREGFQGLEGPAKGQASAGRIVRLHEEVRPSGRSQDGDGGSGAGQVLAQSWDGCFLGRACNLFDPVSLSLHSLIVRWEGEAC